jgi:hypothetical protein
MRIFHVRVTRSISERQVSRDGGHAAAVESTDASPQTTEET